ncbi:MAG: M23 family metallopeptidase [Clostridia bacterium]|nr:M23 family metallopeptidase [Clostridia bacterium]
MEPNKVPQGGNNQMQHQGNRGASVPNKRKGIRGLWDNLKNGVKNVRKGITQGAKQSFKNLFIAVIAKLSPILIIVIAVLVFMAAVNYVVSEKPSELLESSVSTYFSGGYISGGAAGDENDPYNAQKYFDENGSLLLAKDEDIKNISDAFLDDLEKQNNALYNSLSKKNYIGSHKIDETNAYEYMLYAEKFNFNKVNWEKYIIRDKDGNKVDLKTEEFKTADKESDIKDPRGELLEDEKVGLTYPAFKGEERKIEYFTSLVGPYLQSYIIPTAMVSGISTINSENNLGNFAYQIVDKAYHRVTVTQYELWSMTRFKAEQSYYQNNYNIIIYERECDTETEEGCEDGIFYGYRIAELNNAKSKANLAFGVAENRTTVNTSLDTSRYTDRQTDSELSYAITEASTLTTTSSKKYLQVCYNATDVENFQNAQTVVKVGTVAFNNVDLYGSIPKEYKIISEYEIEDGTWQQSKDANGNRKTISVAIKVGETYTYKYQWKDKLELEEGVSRYYTAQDVATYLETGEIHANVDEEISATSILGKDYSYYKSLENDEDLTILDIMNAAPEVKVTKKDGTSETEKVYLDYLDESEAYSDYVGFAKSKLSQSFSIMYKYLAEKNIDYGIELIDATSAYISIDVSGVIGTNFIWPLDPTKSASITSCTGSRILNGAQDTHRGVDIGAADGTPIYAAQAGTVRVAANGAAGLDWSYGYHVQIKHTDIDPNNDYYTVYAHMNSMPVVKAGQEVDVGTLIGYVGNTGNSYGAHLHFEVYQTEKGGGWTWSQDKLLEPLLYIQQSTIPDFVMADTSLPSNCGDMTPGMFGILSQTGGGSNPNAGNDESVSGAVSDETDVDVGDSGVGYIAVDTYGLNSMTQKNSRIKQMTDLEILSRMIYGEQGLNSEESRVLVGLTILNRAKQYGSIYAVTVSTYTGSQSGNKFYNYNCVGNLNNGFWKDIPQEVVNSAKKAYAAFEAGTYIVDGKECIDVYMFKAKNENNFDYKWYNATLQVVLRNYHVGKDYTGFYIYPIN